MINQNISELISHLRADLHALHDDWEVLLKQSTMLKDSKFLEKIANHIKKLDSNAKLALEISKLREQAEVVHYALSTPWGAPFIGELPFLMPQIIIK